MTWSIRLTLGFSKPLNTDEPVLQLQIGGRELEIRPDGDSFKSAGRLIISGHSFASEEEARRYGNRLKSALLLAGARRRIGIDPGEDTSTLRFSEHVIEAMEKKAPGSKYMPTVRGLQVYERQGNEFWISMNATAEVRENLERFSGELGRAFEEAENYEEREYTALRIVAQAEAANDPIATAALYISAVEYVATGDPWTSQQEDLINKLKAVARDEKGLPSGEAEEVVRALDQLFKSIRQRIKRKVLSLGLTNDWNEFDNVYSLRSAIFHGNNTAPEMHRKLSAQAAALCKKIVLAAIAQATSAR